METSWRRTHYMENRQIRKTVFEQIYLENILKISLQQQIGNAMGARFAFAANVFVLSVVFQENRARRPQHHRQQKITQTKLVTRVGHISTFNFWTTLFSAKVIVELKPTANDAEPLQRVTALRSVVHCAKMHSAWLYPIRSNHRWQKPT